MIPRPEYPRPQWKRDEWLCLNGRWQFEIDHADTGRERGLLEKRRLGDAITVPFCPESELSGVGHTDFMKAVWYRREVKIPSKWKGSRILLHFQAVDYEATVWVNGKEVARHTGGWTPFTCDITKAAKPGSKAVVVLRARDDTRSPLQPGGKQSPKHDSHGCYYTRTTGIWQTVWMEPVPKAYLERPKIVPDLDARRVAITAGINVPRGKAAAGMRVRAELVKGRRVVAADEVAAGFRSAQLTLHVDEADLRPWSMEDPFLYDVVVTLLARSGKELDRATAYTGVRKVDIDGVAVRLNGEPVFMRTVLDQGYYPDGIMTAPTERALVNDIKLSMKCGFNGARLHQKVFEERFLYHCDRLGYIVWGEYGDWGAGRGGLWGLWGSWGSAAWVREWTEVLNRDLNHPAIIGWCPLNETHDTLHDRVRPLDEITQAMYEVTRAVDPTRPVLDVSGYNHRVREADIYDVHDYEQSPGKLARHYAAFAKGGSPWINESQTIHNIPYDGQPFFVSEMGGAWWNPKAAATEPSWGYGDRPKTSGEFARRFKGLVGALLKNPRICGYCYTQLTDVEQEQNGVLHANRSKKVDLDLLRAAQQRRAAIEK